MGAGDGRPLGERDYSLAAAPGAHGTGGIYPILDTDRALMEKVSQHSDLVFDAVGGELANTLLSVLRGVDPDLLWAVIRAAADPDAR